MSAPVSTKNETLVLTSVKNRRLLLPWQVQVAAEPWPFSFLKRGSYREKHIFVPFFRI